MARLRHPLPPAPPPVPTTPRPSQLGLQSHSEPPCATSPEQEAPSPALNQPRSPPTRRILPPRPPPPSAEAKTRAGRLEATNKSASMPDDQPPTELPRASLGSISDETKSTHEGPMASRSRSLSGDRMAQLIEGASEDSSLCVICLDQKRTMCLVPCGHLILCEACCTPSIYHCPVCRRYVESSMKVYLA